MQVLKIGVEGLVTSFRYPHFVQGMHPTYEMPPPATIYGHICSAVGDYIGQDSTRFAYYFRFEAKFTDYEHLHFFGSKPKMNPFNRELLFNPQLTLYLDRIDLAEYFFSPRYAVALGRSQDLMSYTSVEVIELEQAEETFFEGTLLPLEISAAIGGGAYAVTMPRFIDEHRRPTWGQYAILRDAVKYPPNDLGFEEYIESVWVDPYPDARNTRFPGLQRGIIWHSWRD